MHRIFEFFGRSSLWRSSDVPVVGLGEMVLAGNGVPDREEVGTATSFI